MKEPVVFAPNPITQPYVTVLRRSFHFAVYILDVLKRRLRLITYPPWKKTFPLISDVFNQDGLKTRVDDRRLSSVPSIQ